MPATPEEVQEIKDAEHLRLLSIFHFVNGAFFLIGLFFLILHGTFTGVILTMATRQARSGPPPGVFGIIIGIYVIVGNIIAVQAIFNVLSGLNLRKRRRRVLSIVVAAINCLQFPLGTLLGVFTISVLVRDSIRKMYEQQALGDSTAAVNDSKSIEAVP